MDCVYLFQMLYAITFFYLFYRLNDEWLTVVFGGVAAFQLLIVLGMSANYQAVMTVFIALQILLSLRGMLYGYLEKHHSSRLRYPIDRLSGGGQCQTKG